MQQGIKITADTLEFAYTQKIPHRQKNLVSLCFGAQIILKNFVISQILVAVVTVWGSFNWRR